MAIAGECSDPSLHLPRILCLHGGGTNARIFQLQCRAFKWHLGHEFRFIFAQAPFPSTPGPDVTAVYRDYGPFRAWIRRVHEDEDQDLCASEASTLIQSAINDAIVADDRLGATGEVIGVLGFSQGARIAASILYNQQLRSQRLGIDPQTTPQTATGWPHFRFAVLMAGRGRLVWLTPDAPMPATLVRPVQPAGLPPQMLDDAANWNGMQVEDKLKLPTVHVHGIEDAGLDFHRLLNKRYCLPSSSTVVEWQGEHRVPIKTKDVHLVADEIKRLAR